jgi:hypothetical protein
MTIDELLAREAIRYTLALYNNAGDRGAVDEMMRCFTGDAVLELGDDRPEGWEAIRAYFRAILDSGLLGGTERRAARHYVTTSRIELDDAQTAHGWSYFLLIRGDTILQTGMYIDRFRKIGDAWLLSSRRVKLEHDGLNR